MVAFSYAVPKLVPLQCDNNIKANEKFHSRTFPKKISRSAKWIFQQSYLLQSIQKTAIKIKDDFQTLVFTGKQKQSQGPF